MSAVNNHLFEVYASDATKNEDETQIAECKKNFKSTSTHMRANVFRSDENIFMETEEKEKTTAEISKNETLDVECKRARNNNKGKNVKIQYNYIWERKNEKGKYLRLYMQLGIKRKVER